MLIPAPESIKPRPKMRDIYIPTRLLGRSIRFAEDGGLGVGTSAKAAGVLPTLHCCCCDCVGCGCWNSCRLALLHFFEKWPNFWHERHCNPCAKQRAVIAWRNPHRSHSGSLKFKFALPLGKNPVAPPCGVRVLKFRALLSRCWFWGVGRWNLCWGLVSLTWFVSTALTPFCSFFSVNAAIFEVSFCISFDCFSFSCVLACIYFNNNAFVVSLDGGARLLPALLSLSGRSTCPRPFAVHVSEFPDANRWA